MIELDTVFKDCSPIPIASLRLQLYVQIRKKEATWGFNYAFLDPPKLGIVLCIGNRLRDRAKTKFSDQSQSQRSSEGYVSVTSRNQTRLPFHD